MLVGDNIDNGGLDSSRSAIPRCPRTSLALLQESRSWCLEYVKPKHWKEATARAHWHRYRPALCDCDAKLLYVW